MDMAHGTTLTAHGAVWRKYTYIDEYNVSLYEWEQEHMHGDYAGE